MKALITNRAALVLGLDDQARYADIKREWVRQGFYVELDGSTQALEDLATELNDRATEGQDGFAETPARKLTARRAVIALKIQGIHARK